jgi:hypothetical protein
MLRIFVSLLNCWTPQVGGLIDMTTILLVDFNDYRVTHYNPNAPLNPLPLNQVNQAAQAGGGAVPAGGGGAPQAIPAELFDRGIKKDKDHYITIPNSKTRRVGMPFVEVLKQLLTFTVHPMCWTSTMLCQSECQKLLHCSLVRTDSCIRFSNPRSIRIWESRLSKAMKWIKTLVLFGLL